MILDTSDKLKQRMYEVLNEDGTQHLILISTDEFGDRLAAAILMGLKFVGMSPDEVDAGRVSFMNPNTGITGHFHLAIFPRTKLSETMVNMTLLAKGYSKQLQKEQDTLVLAREEADGIQAMWFMEYARRGSITDKRPIPEQN